MGGKGWTRLTNAVEGHNDVVNLKKGSASGVRIASASTSTIIHIDLEWFNISCYD
ncbi:MAG: hypothetical protein NVS4B8_07040 [Herpetosiphon sp.]